MTETSVGNEDSRAPQPHDRASFATNPAHLPGHTLRWTTANVDEGLPGTVTPLTWSLYGHPTEQTMRDCWVDLGVLPKSNRPIPDDIDERFLSVAYGHAIANVDHMGQMAALVPGGSSAMMEEQLFGSVQAGGLPEPRGWSKVKRYPIIAVKFPVALRKAIIAFGPLADETEKWWSDRAFAVADADLDDAVRSLVDARVVFERGLAVHMVLSMAAQGLMGQVESLATATGLASGGELIKSDEGTAEFELVRDLWRLSRDEIDMDTFIRTHGYHGPREGLVDAVVWREDSSPLVALAQQYRSRAGGEGVDTLVERRRREHAAAIGRLDEGLGPVRRRFAHLLIRFASRVPTWRETGRANILRGVDVARASARTVGRRLVEKGVLSRPDDVLYLTIDELAEGSVETYPELVRQRRSDHSAFAAIDLPHVWHGAPQPVERAARDAPPPPSVTSLTGLGVSAGIAEGIVRVIFELDDADVDDGTVLVCKATDPGWASLFPLAEAVITDVGSAMSHAAIVCRELGLPCVANTRIGTVVLRDGMRVRVDGSTGLVEVLSGP